MSKNAIIFHGTGGNPNVNEIYFINSINDPYGCDDKQGRAMFDVLGGTQLVLDQGHFGSPEQVFEKFELLNRLIT